MATKLKTREEILEEIRHNGSYETYSPTEADRARELVGHGVFCIFATKVPGSRRKKYRFVMNKCAR